MRTKSVLLICALLFIFISAFAHAADDIKMVPSLNEGIFSTRVVHNTNNPEKHFINKIEVSVNGKLLIVQEFLRQRDKNAQEAIYVMPSLKAGDEIVIKATCNLGGEKTGTFKIEEEEEEK